MPNITQYEAGEIGLRPSEVGIEATAAAARRAGAFFNQAAESRLRSGQMLGSAIQAAGDVAVEYATHQDKSHGSKVYADGFLSLSQQWEELKKNSDPNDPTLATKFMKDNVEPFLDKFQQGFFTEGGQKWGENMAMQLRQHLTEKTTADMSILSGIATASNIKGSVNKYKVNVFGSPDFHTIDASLKGVEDTYTANIENNKNLSALGKLKLKDEMENDKRDVLTAALYGAAGKNSGLAEKLASRYPDLVDTDQFKRILSAAKQDERINREIAKRDAVEASHNKMLELRGQLFDKNGNYRPDRNWLLAVEADQTLSKADKNDLTTAKSKLDADAKNNAFNPETYGEFRSRIGDKNNPLTIPEVVKAEGKPFGEGITAQQADHFIKRIKEVETAEGERMSTLRGDALKRIESSIDSNMGSFQGRRSALGQKKMLELEQELLQREHALGPQATTLYDRKSTNYFGNWAMNYHVSLKEIQSYQTELEKKSSKNLGEVTGVKVEELPPMEGAKRAPDGQWYIERQEGNVIKYYRVKK